MRGQRIARTCAIIIALVTSLAFCNSGVAQTVTWGVNGVGGSGNWTTTTANWFDGTNNVFWPNNGNAVFAGASGATVEVFGGFPVVSSIAFNTSGYKLFGGFLEGGSGGLTVTSNVDATFGADVTASFPSGSSKVTKDGPATLTLQGASFGPLQVNQGQVDAIGTVSLPAVTLANAPGVILTLDPSSSAAQIPALSGGGSAGGIVQPANKTETVNLSLTVGGTSFGGVLADNGSGILALNYQGTTTQTLTGVNTYSGPTTIASGTLALSGNGSATSTTMSVSPGATLQLDDSGTVIGNRLSAAAPISMNAGNLILNGNSTAPVNESAGPLQVAGASTITVNQPGSAPTRLSFAGLTLEGHSTLTVNGPGVSIPGLVNGSTGIVTPYVTTASDWATVGADGTIAPFTAYANDINTASAKDNVQLLPGSGTTTLAAPATVGSLKLPLLSQGVNLDLGGHELTLATGGILANGSGISDGNLSTPSGEFVITTKNNASVFANIVDSPGGTALTKAGPGTLTLFVGNNTYTGPTTITQGAVVVDSAARLGLGTVINIDGGSLLKTIGFGPFVFQQGINTDSTGGTIDTFIENPEFSGAAFGNLTKIGLGTLTLDNSMLSNLTVTQGSVVLLHSSSGTITAANLQAVGTIASFTWTSPGFPLPTLDIGGPAAATLTIGTLSDPLITPVQINFGLGATASDLLNITGHMSFPGNARIVQFEFQNLGGLATGVEYQLISLPGTGSAPFASTFALAPDLIAAGWAGTFTTSPSGVYIEFSHVPEPASLVLLGAGAAALLMARARRRHSMSPRC